MSGCLNEAKVLYCCSKARFLAHGENIRKMIDKGCYKQSTISQNRSRGRPRAGFSWLGKIYRNAHFFVAFVGSATRRPKNRKRAKMRHHSANTFYFSAVEEVKRGKERLKTTLVLASSKFEVRSSSTKSSTLHPSYGRGGGKRERAFRWASCDRGGRWAMLPSRRADTNK